MVLQKKFRVTSPVQITTDFFDTTTGKAIQTFFLGVTGGVVSGVKNTLNKFIHYSDPVGEQLQISTNIMTTYFTRNFVLDFSTSRVIDGTIILNIPIGTSSSLDGQIRLEVSGAIIKESGGVSSAIVSDVSTRFEPSTTSGQYHTLTSLNFPLVNEVFKRGDKLMMQIEFRARESVGGGTPNVGWAFDPQNRDGSTSVGNTFITGNVTQSTLVIPFNPTF